MIYDSILETIGHTPVIRLSKVKQLAGYEILVKLESFNPAGSIKDRTALSMITQAERDGRLKPNGVIVESTSGNVGKALALIGAARGYRVVLVIDPKTPRSMIEFVSALGAEVEMVDTPDESGGFQRPRFERVQQLNADIPNAFWPNQFNNPDNPRVHAEMTAKELLEDVPQFDALIAAVSTGGHLSGLAATVKQQLSHVVTVGVDADGSGAFGYPVGKYKMRGLGLSWQPGNLDRSVVDRLHRVADEEGIATMRTVAKAEGVLVGESGGAAIFAALHHAHRHPGSRIVVVVADGGVNYLGDHANDGPATATEDPKLGGGTLAGLIEAAADPRNWQVSLDPAGVGVRGLDREVPVGVSG